MTYVDFFSDLGFDFNVELRPKTIDIEKETTLSQKLKNSVFFIKVRITPIPLFTLLLHR